MNFQAVTNFNTAIRQIVTGRDNETHDVVRWLAILTAITAVALTAYTVIWKNTPFDIQAFGIGMGAVFTTVGAALKLKETTEPGNHVESSTQVTQVTPTSVVQTKDVKQS